MTDPESPRKNDDCYFYYYSTCTKGDNCTFRHEPSALGCKTTCTFWKEGKCVYVHCNFRHMKLMKNRKTMQCYWETQSSGCKKPHCPFLHSSPKSLSSEGETSNLKISDEGHFGSPVDPLVVRFEQGKTLEDIKLEQIQAESAGYYSYPDPMETIIGHSLETSEFLRNRTIKRMKIVNPTEKQVDLTKVIVLSLDEIRKRKHKDSSKAHFSKPKKQKLTAPKVQTKSSELKIKTLDEIRAEKPKRFSETNKEVVQLTRKKISLRKDVTFTSEMEFTSTSVNEESEDMLGIPEGKNIEEINSTVKDEISLVHEDIRTSVHTSENTINIDNKPDSCLKLDDFLQEDDDIDTSNVKMGAEDDTLKSF